MKDRLKVNILYQLSYQTLVLLYPLLTTPVISRAFGSEVYGIYGYTYSIAFYFSLIAVLGIHTYGARMVAFKRNDRREFSCFFGNCIQYKSCALF